MASVTTSKLPRRISASADPETLAAEILRALKYRVGKDMTVATPHDWLTASIQVVRDRIIDEWIQSTKEAYDQQEKRVYYLSLEFLIGRLMRDAFSNLGLLEDMRAALEVAGRRHRRDFRPRAGRGARQWRSQDDWPPVSWRSMATVDIPAHGYGIRYANGMFRQEISDGWQVELPENWLDHGNPWEFERRERSFEVGFGGQWNRSPPRTATWSATSGSRSGAHTGGRLRHAGRRLARQPREHAQAVVGYGDRSDPARRLQCRATISAHCARATRPKRSSRVLYPARFDIAAGQELRLRQEYFFSDGLAAGHRRSGTSASLAICCRCPTRRRSISTTPIRRSRSPS